jgi:LysR family nitrogen assimilation transcriptional regulator
MDAQLLGYFLKVSETGSISRAARELHLSQPALSRHMAALEHGLGASVFVRTGGGVTLTEAGRLLASRAQPLLRQWDILREQVGATAAGHLSLGISPSWHDAVTADFVQQLMAAHPEVQLRVHEGPSHVLRDAMAAGLLDLAVIPFAAAAVKGYAQSPLLREPAVLVGPASAGLRREAPVSIDRLAGLPLVLPSRPNALRAQVEQALERRGQTFRLAAEVDTVALCLSMARRGVAHTVVPSLAVWGDAAREGLGWAPVTGLQMNWMLCENQARQTAPAVSRARALFMEIAVSRWPAARPGKVTLPLSLGPPAAPPDRLSA